MNRRYALLGLGKQRCSESLDWIARTDSMRAVREGLLWLTPCLLVSAIFLMLAAMIDMTFGADSLSADLLAIHRGINKFIPLLAAASIAYMLSIKKRLPRLPIASLCFAYVSIAASLLEAHSGAALTLLLFVAITTPLVTVPLLAFLYRQPWTNVTRDEIAGENVKNALNLIVPGILGGLLVAFVLKMLLMLPAFDSVLLKLELDIGGSPALSGSTFAAVNSLLWFFGIHGYHALLPLIDAMDSALRLNQTAVAMGMPPSHPINSAFLASFVFIGGSGATLSLVIATLLLCKNRMLRLLALASIPIGLLNVNEILLFGLPIIFNPRLLVPFVLVPVANVLLGLAAMTAGLVSPTITLVPFNSPIGLNAYLATGGDAAAIGLQAALLLMGTLIYAPFIRRIDELSDETTQIHLQSLDTTYSQLHEEATLYGYDPVINANSLRTSHYKNAVRLATMTEQDFFLEYQPQVCANTRLFTGCEALLRSRDPHGKVRSAGEFMAWLEDARLMKQVDLWVARAAVRQHHVWRGQGLDIPFTINITAETLADPEACMKLIDHLQGAGGYISVEITEKSLIADASHLQSVMAAFHRVGAKVYIDDFGTGYSAIAYLHRFQIDAIKIDRSFVLALDDEKGRKVMRGVLGFAEELGLATIVEGVETEAQMTALQSRHPISVQGWLFSKALPGDALPAYIARLRQQSGGIAHARPTAAIPTPATQA